MALLTVQNKNNIRKTNNENNDEKNQSINKSINQ